ncbi:MAG: sigma-54-dependent Fis family transcriptional regulator [Nitrospirae bacterium]|nr:sigma-54-dependent Fis family transcriptional regulator [Nitrospirota bacterium]
MHRLPEVLIIDDEPLMRISISDALKAEGCNVSSAATGSEGLKAVKEAVYDIVITDLRLPQVDGVQILKMCRQVSQHTKVLMITAYGSVDSAVEAMKTGAYDYITKPFSMDELILTVKRLIELRDLEDENIYLKEKIEQKYHFSGIIGKSDKMQDVFEKIRIIAPTDTTVLISGESGTGKELVANAIHYNSPRKSEAFIKVSCAALPETLLEAELFGHERGAFTGALKQKKGRFELAHKGTLFLDEIGEINQTVQVKLLRVLQEREFERLGGTNTINVDVRIIGATQRDLKKEVQKGNFREDLYYRLNVVPVQLPPLRDRKEDILLLTDHFLKMHARHMNKPLKGISVDAKEFILKYDFPGNIRELENAVRRAVTLSRDKEIQPWDLPEDMCTICGEGDRIGGKLGYSETLPTAISLFEKQYILRVLEETKGNKTLAAKVLGISRKTLWEKSRLYGMLKKEDEDIDDDNRA